MDSMHFNRELLKRALIAAAIGVSLKFMLLQEEEKKRFEQHDADFQGTT